MTRVATLEAFKTVSRCSAATPPSLADVEHSAMHGRVVRAVRRSVPMGPAEPTIAVRPPQSRLREGPSAPTRCAPAVSARSRCSRMLWDVIVRLGAVASGATVLAGLLIDESIETHVLSAVVFAA